MAFTGSPQNCCLERFEQRQLRTIPLQLRTTPTMTDIETRPPELLRILRLDGKGPCGAKCGCRKAPTIKPKSDRTFFKSCDCKLQSTFLQNASHSGWFRCLFCISFIIEIQKPIYMVSLT